MSLWRLRIHTVDGCWSEITNTYEANLESIKTLANRGANGGTTSLIDKLTGRIDVVFHDHVTIARLLPPEETPASKAPISGGLPS